MSRYLLIDNESVHTDKLAKLLPEKPDILRWDNLTTLDPLQYDLIVLSGSGRMPVMGNETTFRNELQLIRETTVPLIGICFGAELINRAFDGTLHDLGAKRQGIVDILSTDAAGILLKPDQHFSVYEAHRWIIDTLAPEFSVLAKSDHGPEIIKHSTRPVWGLQFHPEHLTESTLGDEIFSRILSQLPTTH